MEPSPGGVKMTRTIRGIRSDPWGAAKSDPYVFWCSLIGRALPWTADIRGFNTRHQRQVRLWTSDFNQDSWMAQPDDLPSELRETGFLASSRPSQSTITAGYAYGLLVTSPWRDN